MSDTREFLNVAEASELMGLSQDEVRRICREGGLPGAIQSWSRGPWKIPLQAIESWEANQVKSSPVAETIQEYEYDELIVTEPETAKTSLDEPTATPGQRIVFWEKKWYLGISAIIVFLASLATIWADSGLGAGIIAYLTTPTTTPTVTPQPTETPLPSRTPEPTATPVPFLPEAAGETLFVIATFYRTEGVVDVAVHDEIRRAIQKKVDDLELENVRIELEPTVVESLDRESAEELGKRYNASFVIWGSDTGIRLEVNFLNLRKPFRDAGETVISEVSKTQLAEPDAYSRFVITDLPGQLAYLSLFSLGQVEWIRVNNSEAIQLIEAAVDSLSSLANPLDLVLDAAYFRLGWLYQITEDIPQAIEYYDKTIALNPEHFTAYNNRGNAYKDLLDYEQAIADYDRVIDLNPDSTGVAEALNNRAGLYAELGDYELALADYDSAIVLAPDYEAAFINRGLVYTYMGDLDQAITNFDQALADFDEGLVDHDRIASEYDPTNVRIQRYAMAFYNRGLTFSNLGDYEKAVADYDWAIALDPEDASAFAARGQVYHVLGDIEQAISDYSHAIDLDPDDYGVFFNRGTAYSDEGDYKQALADFDRAIILNPGFAGAYTGRGSAYYHQGDYEMAINDLDQAVNLDPQYPYGFFVRATVYEEIEQYGKAIADLRTLLEFELQPSQREAFEDVIIQLEAKLEN